MDDAGSPTLRWDTKASRWRRRPATDAAIVATNGVAMLVQVPLRSDLHVGSEVDVELAGGSGTVVIRHVAPTGDPTGDALVGIEFLATDEVLARHVASEAAGAAANGTERWWWQRGT
jgi:hypothetical protein